VKRVVSGSDVHVYDAAHYLVTSVDVPMAHQVLAASPEKPFMSLTLELDVMVLAELLMNAPPRGREDPGESKSRVEVGSLDRKLLWAFLRLLDLLDHPRDIPVLAPLIVKEISYRLLTGEVGHRLRQIVSARSYGHQIAKAIEWLKDNFRSSFLVKELADLVGMSPSSFHAHFHSLTALSPIQYQKKLRLLEARRIMLVDKLDASDAGYRVGYESPSQFSREYSRLFGAPPSKDLKNLRNDVFLAGGGNRRGLSRGRTRGRPEGKTPGEEPRFPRPEEFGEPRLEDPRDKCCRKL
jgi:AraC-like DNA-binding protein